MPFSSQTAGVGRPKSDKPKSAAISLKTFPEVREIIEELARTEHRTVAQMADLLLREAVIARLKKAKRDASTIEDLP